MVCLGFSGLLDASVQEADIGHRLDDRLALDGQDQAQHSMRAGVLGTHIDSHPIITLLAEIEVAIGGVLIFYLLLLHKRVLFDDADRQMPEIVWRRYDPFVVPGS